MRGAAGYVVTGVAALLVGVALTLVVVVVARWLPPGSEVTAEVCDVDPSVSGFQGWCVQRREAPAGLATGERHEVRVVGVFDGAEDDRSTAVPVGSQDAGDPFEVTFAEDGVEVLLDGGVRLWLPADYYAVD